MNLQQLHYICAVASNDLNISLAAERLHTSQPGVSKQIRQLEDELGVDIFERAGKRLTGITPVGHAVLENAAKVLDCIMGIREMAAEYSHPAIGSLSVATTHTQARYVLPRIVKQFIGHYPAVNLHIHEGSPNEIARLAENGIVDFAIATEALHMFEGLAVLPCYRWNRAVVTPKKHPLANKRKKISLSDVNEYPLLTYVFGFTGRSKLDQAFKREGLQPRIALTATDTDVLKTYIRAGLGVGILAHTAYDPRLDKDLAFIDASHLFEPSITSVAFRRGSVFRGFHYDFIRLFAPHLSRNILDEVSKSAGGEAYEKLVKQIMLIVDD